jgi:MFS family permease
VFLDRIAQFCLAPYIISDLHLSNEQVGILASATALARAICTILSGAISDRVGRRRHGASSRAAAHSMPVAQSPVTNSADRRSSAALPLVRGS